VSFIVLEFLYTCSFGYPILGADESIVDSSRAFRIHRDLCTNTALLIFFLKKNFIWFDLATHLNHAN
jgi:hypothetical protein